MVAHADDLDTWTSQIRTDADFKVRLSAGLRLGKLGDRRAFPALVEALGDDVAAVRTICARALANVVDKEIAAAERARGLAALRQLAAKDPDAHVRGAAQASIAAFELVERVARPRSTKNGVFVLVESVSDLTGSLDEKTLATLTAAGRDTLLATDETFLVEWPGGAPPTRKQLKGASARAVTLMTSVAAMNVSDKGKQVQVECQLKLILATYPDRAAKTFIDGKAKLETDARPTSVERAKTRCATDMVKHLMGGKLAKDINAIAR